MFRLQSQTRGEQTSLIEEMVANQKVVQAFGQEAAVRKRFDQINERLERASLKATFFSSLTNPCTRFVNSLVYTGVGIFGAVTAVAGGISVGQLASFLSYANQYTKPFNEISGVVTELQNAIACAGRLLELIDETPQEAEPDDAVILTDAKGNVSLEHVDFSYQAGQKLIEDFTGRARSNRRPYRVRKNDADQSFDAVLRYRRRMYPGRRNASAPHYKKKPAVVLRYGTAGDVASGGCHSGKYSYGESGRFQRGSDRSRKSLACAQFYQTTAQRVRYGDHRRGRRTLAGAKTAFMHSKSDAFPAADADSG